MRNKGFFFRAGGIASGVLLSVPLIARADLRDPDILAQLSPFEQRAALANQAVYDQLTIDPDGAGPLQAQCGFFGGSDDSFCADSSLQLVFENVRELVDTANDIGGNGSTTYSLRYDVANLGFALRWTAAEEFAAQGASATDFSNSQLGALASRLSALRFGARGMRLANRTTGESALLADNRTGRLGGGASADADSIASRWSAFIDGSFGSGAKDDSTFDGGFEDAFDFDGREFTLGMDHRFTDSIVAGVMGGYSNKSIDFDLSRSIVDASMEVEGYSLIAYALWEHESFYVNGSIGGQWLDLDTRRRIFYPSFNPRVESVDSTALSTTSSSAVTATFGAGFDARAFGMTFGPYLKVEHQDITIDGFTEGGPVADGFGFAVGSQKIKSLDTALGVRAQRVFTPSFGVMVPYLRAEYHKEFENEPRTLSSIYADSSSIATNGAFSVPTDEPDDDFVLLATGFSMVWPHGLQGFLQYQQVVGLDRYSDRVITAGLRYEL